MCFDDTNIGLRPLSAHDKGVAASPLIAATKQGKDDEDPQSNVDNFCFSGVAGQLRLSNVTVLQVHLHELGAKPARAAR